MRAFARWTSALALSVATLATTSASAHPITVDGSSSEWLAREAAQSNQGLIARGASGFGSYVWRDSAADTRTDLSSPETIADLTYVRVTSSSAGLSFHLTLNAANANTVSNPVQIQVAIDTDRVSGSGQNFLAGFADTQVPDSARWERLVQTQFTSGATARVWNDAFTVVNPSVTVGVQSTATATGVEMTVPWASLGLSGPPSTPLRFTFATFRELPGGNTVNLGDGSVPNALDVVSDYGTPRTSVGAALNTFTEFSSAGDQRVDYNVDLYFNQSTGDVYAPLLITRYISNASNDAAGGGEWIAVRNVTPASLPLTGFRLGDEETPDGAGEGIGALPAVSLAAGATFIAAESGANYLARFGERPDAEWNATDPMVPDLVAYTTWTSSSLSSLALANGGDELLVIDRSHTIVDVGVYGSAGYAGVVPMTAPAANAVALRNTTTFADTDDCSVDFTTTTSLCADDAACGLCGTCSLNTCTARAAGTTCRVSAGTCDVAETCDGTSIACPADGFALSTTSCRASAGSCDVAETCTGSSAACPADSFITGGTVCRAATGACDAAETCTGSSATCPTDQVAPMITVCRASAGACDTAETCDGITTACPADAKAMSATVCRSSGGACDVAETCDGTSDTCPADTLRPSTTVCRASTGVCDATETCDGSTAACPADRVAPSTTVCRSSAGVCDVAETCDGSTAMCPADRVAPTTTVCRAGAGVCDVAETCDGTSSACPADRVAPNTTVCRSSAGPCDVSESCDGVATACPANSFATVGTSCADSDRCNGDELCNGSGTCVAGSPVLCPPAPSACTLNTCNSSSGACVVSNAMMGASCSDGVFCNGEETCNGSGTCLSGTTPSDAGSVCDDGGSDAGDASDAETDSGVDTGASDAAADASTPDADDAADGADATDDAMVSDASADGASTEDAMSDGSIPTDTSVEDTNATDTGVAPIDVAVDGRDARAPDGASDVVIDGPGAERDPPSGGGCSCRTTPAPGSLGRGARLALLLMVAAMAMHRRALRPRAR